MGTLWDVTAAARQVRSARAKAPNYFRFTAGGCVPDLSTCRLWICPLSSPQVVSYVCVGRCEGAGPNFAMPRCQQEVEGRIGENGSSASRRVSLWWGVELPSSD